ncbi:MAG: TonB-dependent receptor [Chitinophagaceae bacterium]|nr:TonB-dependent receptor [Chitinophagaceae bacterium]
MRKLVTMLLCIVLAASQLAAQTRTIKGKVTDSKSSPVSNASVVVKGSTTGTTTDANGDFSISVPASAKALVISSLNFASQEVSIVNRNSVLVSLVSTTQDLQEVVVVGYGTQRKTNVTGSVATVKAAEIENKPFSSVDKALQGAVAGLQSVASSGAPGSAQNIRIRGVSSINASNAPLWVIDGVPVNSGDASRLTTTANLLSTMNSDDIESVTVLKDAASTAIYGSRGANGVILVTTKKGRAGNTKFTFSTEIGTSDIAYKSEAYRPLTATEYLAITKEGLINAGATQAQIDANLASLGLGNNTDFNWLDNVTRKGTQQQYNLSASGGNEKTTFYMSGGYFKQEGTTIATDMDRVNAAMRVTNRATDKLTLNMNVQVGSTRQNTPLNGGAFGNPVLSSYFILPTRSAYKADGSYNILTSDFPTNNTFNTIYLAYTDKRYLKELGLRGSGSAEYKILDNLRFKSAIGIDYNSLEETQYNNPFYGDGAVLATGSPVSGPNVQYNTGTTGRIFEYFTRYTNYDWTNTLDYNGKISRSGDFTFNAQVGYEAQLSKLYSISSQGTGFPLTTLLVTGQSTATPKTASSTFSDYAFTSQFASGGLNYKDRYVVSGTFRRDASSRFGINNRYGNFWSVGASWNVSNEGFMQNISAINLLKLRASYGVTGNAGIGNYDWIAGDVSGANYNQSPGYAPGAVGNNDLTWELNKPLNIGVDLSMFKNRLSITFDWYKRKSEDLLLAVQLSRTSGFTSATQNIGALYNKGIELTVDVVPVQSRDFKWNVNFNFAANKNVVTDLPNHADIASPTSSLYNLREGYSVQTYFLRQYAGVDPANGDPLWYTDATLKTTTNVYPVASARVMDQSGLPTFFGGFTNTFNFKGFSLSAQFYYSGGNWVFDNFGSYYTGAGFSPTFNKVARVLDRWQKPGDVTDMPKYIYGGNKSFQSTSSFYIQKGDYIRLRNIQVGYDIPKSVLAKAHITNAVFYVRGTNLWTWVKDKKLAFDPEQGTSNVNNLDVLIPKTVTVGLTLGF